MAWTTMHYAVGMGCAGALAGTASLICRRGWRFLPLAMTAGGIWALLPDIPRFFREDFPNLPFAQTLGLKSFERFCHRWGDLFFFHARLDSQPKEYALAGLGVIVLLYNMAICLLLFLEYRQRNSIGNRAFKAHQHHMHSSGRRTRGRRARTYSSDVPPELIAPPPRPFTAPPIPHDGDPVIHRIVPEDADRTG